MDAYLIVGNPSTRRASLVRSLSGCFNRSLRDILPRDATRPLRVYARAVALQDTGTSAEDFIAEVRKARCEAVLCCLAASPIPGGAGPLPGAPEYVAAFKAEGWNIRAIVVLGQNAGGLKPSTYRQFPHAGTQPINQTASDVRALFGWR